MKSDELKGIIVARRSNYSECARALGISLSSFTNKINSGKFYVSEARKLSEFLQIRNREYIFLRD